MKNSYIRRLNVIAIGLVLTTGLLVGCGSDNTDSPSAQTSEQQVSKQSEETQEHKKSHHNEEGHHDKEGHEDRYDHKRADHFEGKKAETFDEAVSNMKKANNKLENLLTKGELSGTDFFQIHRMSYTLENALAKIREETNGDYSSVAKHLESVHLASERKDAETVLQDGKKYLEGARAMLKEVQK